MFELTVLTCTGYCICDRTLTFEPFKPISWGPDGRYPFVGREYPLYAIFDYNE